MNNLTSFLDKAAAQNSPGDAICWNCKLPSTRGHINKDGLCSVCAAGQ